MTWSADVEALLGALRPIAAREIAPAAARWDSSGELEAEVASRIAEWGMFGTSAPEGAGGVGAGMLGAAAIVEEVASHSGALAMRLALHEAVAIGFALETADTAMVGRLVGATAFVGAVGVGRGLQVARSAGRTRVHGHATMVPGDGALVVAARDATGVVVGMVESDAVGTRRRRASSGLRALGCNDIVIMNPTMAHCMDSEICCLLIVEFTKIAINREEVKRRRGNLAIGNRQ